MIHSKKILFVSKYSPPWMSVPLIKNIEKYFKNDVIFISRKYSKIGFPFDLFLLQLNILKTSFRINKIIVYNDMSLVLATFPLLRLISFFKKIDCYYIFESKWFNKYANYFKFLFLYSLNNKIYKKIFVFDDLLEDYLSSKEINKNKFVEISTGVDSKIFKPTFKRKEFDFKLIYVGSIDKLRKMDILIAIIEILKREYPKIKLTIIGDGHSLNDLRLLAERKLLKENIIFTGKLPQEKIVTYIHNSDICLAQYPPDVFDIQLPYKILEYFACKKPVITTETIATKKYLENKENCILCSFDPYEIAKSVILLINDCSLRIKISENGYNLSKQFRWKNVLSKIRKEVYP